MSFWDSKRARAALSAAGRSPNGCVARPWAAACILLAHSPFGIRHHYNPPRRVQEMQLNHSALFQRLASPPPRLSCERAWHTPRITRLISSTSRPSSPARHGSAGTRLHDSDVQPPDQPPVLLPLPSGTKKTLLQSRRSPKSQITKPRAEGTGGMVHGAQPRGEEAPGEPGSCWRKGGSLRALSPSPGPGLMAAAAPRIILARSCCPD